MSQPIDAGAIIYPKADKVARALELLSTVVDHVNANEPGTLTYQCFTTEGEGVEPMILFFERYADEAAMAQHMQNTRLAEVFKIVAAEELLVAPPKIFKMNKGPGWLKRE